MDGGDDHFVSSVLRTWLKAFLVSLFLLNDCGL